MQHGKGGVDVKNFLQRVCLAHESSPLALSNGIVQWLNNSGVSSDSTLHARSSTRQHQHMLQEQRLVPVTHFTPATIDTQELVSAEKGEITITPAKRYGFDWPLVRHPLPLVFISFPFLSTAAVEISIGRLTCKFESRFHVLKSCPSCCCSNHRE
jgi:hypothetical protein